MESSAKNTALYGDEYSHSAEGNLKIQNGFLRRFFPCAIQLLNIIILASLA